MPWRPRLRPFDGVGELARPDVVGEEGGRDLPGLVLHRAPQVGESALSRGELADQLRVARLPVRCQFLLLGLQLGCPRRHRRVLGLIAFGWMASRHQTLLTLGVLRQAGAATSGRFTSTSRFGGVASRSPPPLGAAPLRQATKAWRGGQLRFSAASSEAKEIRLAHRLVGGKGNLLVQPRPLSAPTLLQLLGPLRMFPTAPLLFALVAVEDLDLPANRGLELLRGARALVKALRFGLGAPPSRGRRPSMPAALGPRASRTPRVSSTLLARSSP